MDHSFSVRKLYRLNWHIVVAHEGYCASLSVFEDLLEGLVQWRRRCNQKIWPILQLTWGIPVTSKYFLRRNAVGIDVVLGGYVEILGGICANRVAFFCKVVCCVFIYFFPFWLVVEIEVCVIDFGLRVLYPLVLLVEDCDSGLRGELNFFQRQAVLAQDKWNLATESNR